MAFGCLCKGELIRKNNERKHGIQMIVPSYLPPHLGNTVMGENKISLVATQTRKRASFPNPAKKTG
jgi:hypothetical protein